MTDSWTNERIIEFQLTSRQKNIYRNNAKHPTSNSLKTSKYIWNSKNILSCARGDTIYTIFFSLPIVSQNLAPGIDAEDFDGIDSDSI
jgi:hypothetical protein